MNLFLRGSHKPLFSPNVEVTWDFQRTWPPAVLSALVDGEEREGELRALHLLVGVLVSVLQPGQAAHAHDQDAVTGVERDDRGLVGDGHLDPEALGHDLDRGLVRGVEAGLDPLQHDRLRMLDRELTLLDRAAVREHAGGDAESEECGHRISPRGRLSPFSRLGALLENNLF